MNCIFSLVILILLTDSGARWIFVQILVTSNKKQNTLQTETTFVFADSGFLPKCFLLFFYFFYSYFFSLMFHMQR